MESMTLTPPKQARAIATRNKLLSAAAHCLCELGARGTTTTAVAKEAGVSQGALYKHFGSKHHLLAATTEHLLATLFTAFQRAFAARPLDDGDKLSKVLPALWGVFLLPELYAVVELYIMARTDEPLREALVPVLDAHRQNLLAEARELFPVAASENPRFDLAVYGIMLALQGAAMNAAVVQEQGWTAAYASFVEQICRRELEPPYGAF